MKKLEISSEIHGCGFSMGSVRWDLLLKCVRLNMAVPFTIPVGLVTNDEGSSIARVSEGKDLVFLCPVY